MNKERDNIHVKYIFNTHNNVNKKNVFYFIRGNLKYIRYKHRHSHFHSYKNFYLT